MCTIIALFGVHRLPLVIAANRDEFYARTADPPMVLAPRIVAGRDQRSGGTWLGATSDGFFVGLTNQRAWEGGGAGPKSRGDVVLAGLRAGSVAAMNRYLDQLDPREFAGFNLLYGDAKHLSVAYARPTLKDVEHHALEAGIHVLANDRLESPDFPKTGRARERAQKLLAHPWPRLGEELKTLLRDRERPPLSEVPLPPAGSPFTHELVRELQALCIETPVYGTVSATLLAMSEAGVQAHWYADGAPHKVDFSDFSALHDPGEGAASFEKTR
ncbi:MAG: NRDE family protein [Myxococcota bacterium]